MSLTNRKSLSPWIKDDIEFYQHQVDGIRTLAKRKSFILGDDMGLGKSLQALTVFGIDVFLGWSKTMMVVCPASLKGNWADEIEKFTTFSYIVLDGNPSERAVQLLEFTSITRPKILIVNYEQVVAHGESLDSMKFDAIAFDEAHYLQNHKSKRTQACLDVFSRRSFMLTGTPMLNHVDGLWAQLYRTGATRKNYYAFCNRYAVMGGYKNKSIIGVKNEQELTELVQDFMLRRTKDEVLDLPKVQMIERKVDLLPQQKELYDEVKSELQLTRVDMSDPEEVKNHLTKFLRLKEICGTTYKFTGEDHSSKLDLAIADDLEILENGHKTVVFTQFRHMQECYTKRLNAANSDIPVWQLNGDVKNEDRQPVIKEWAATSEPGVLVCIFKVGGIGLNMTAARHGSFLDKLFVPGLNQQAVDRLHRIGADETQPIQFRDYVTRGTIENRINQILSVKKKLFGEIVETDSGWQKKLLQILMEEEVA